MCLRGKKILIPFHYDMGNYGCEAITQGTYVICKGLTMVIAYSRNIELDNESGNYEGERRRLRTSYG